MRILIIGKSGQLAWELNRAIPDTVECKSVGQAELDITHHEAVADLIAQYKPDCVINAAAYTAVDKAETDQQTAFSVNDSAVANLAQVCASNNARLLHVSTDFVFNGQKNTPYQAGDVCAPMGVYGASKLAGELAVLKALPADSVIVRTAWVYSSHGNNFVKTMLRLMAEKPQLNVIYDQVGTPTWAKGLAQWLWTVALKPEVQGVFHWTDAGVASWYDFAVAIQNLALAKGLLARAIAIKPIPTSGFPTPAKRPAYSVLDKTSAEEASGLTPVHWQQQLSSMLDELKQQ